MDNLKPCAHCGSNDLYEYNGMVQCNNDDCPSMIEPELGYKIKDWNNRPIEDELRVALENVIQMIDYAVDAGMNGSISNTCKTVIDACAAIINSKGGEV